jgi:hypothetical protein
MLPASTTAQIAVRRKKAFRMALSLSPPFHRGQGKS